MRGAQPLYAALRAAWTHCKVPSARSPAHAQVEDKERERSRKPNAKNVGHRSDLKLRCGCARCSGMQATRATLLSESASCQLSVCVEQHFNDFVADYCAAMELKLCDEKQGNDDARMKRGMMNDCVFIIANVFLCLLYVSHKCLLSAVRVYQRAIELRLNRSPDGCFGFSHRFEVKDPRLASKGWNTPYDLDFCAVAAEGGSARADPFRPHLWLEHRIL